MPALVAAGVGGIALAVCAVAIPTDPAGRLLIGIAAIGLVVIAWLGMTQRPRLAVIDGDKLSVKQIRRTTVYDRAAVVRARIVKYPRLGRRVPMLEIDVETLDEPERLLVFGRWDLGTHPEDVLAALAQHQFAVEL
jgi:autonomous glycyl radical cofactor GrcA